MIANCAFLAGMVVLLGSFWLLGAVQFLAPYRRVIFGDYLWTIVGALVIVFLNLFAAAYLIGRALFLQNTGRKLAHIERQLRGADTIAHDLSEQLSHED